jgi:hypothetical protein
MKRRLRSARPQFSPNPSCFTILLMLSGMVAGCANQLAVRQAYLSQFIGQPEVALVQQIGVPTRTFESAGIRFLAYDERRFDIVPAFPTYSPFFMGWYGGGSPPQVVEWQCETTFAVKDGTVASFTLRGNACG